MSDPHVLDLPVVPGTSWSVLVAQPQEDMTMEAKDLTLFTQEVLQLRWKIMKHRLDAAEVETIEQALREAALIEEWLFRDVAEGLRTGGR